MDKRMAWIQNGVVTNFIIIRSGQASDYAFNTAAIVDPAGEDVHIGDTWNGKQFLRDGKPIKEARKCV